MNAGMLSIGRIARSVGIYWLIFLGSWAIFGAGAATFVHVFKGDPDRMVGAATVGIRNISIPVLNKSADAGLPGFAGFVFVNGSAVILFFSLVVGVRLLDPDRRDRFPRFVRRLVSKDPTLAIFAPIPSFRRIPDMELRQVFAALAIAPLAVPLGVAALVGLLTGANLEPGNAAASILFNVSLILPHGIFELTAFFVTPACLSALYKIVRPDAEAGRTESVWEALRPELRTDRWLPRLAFSLVLVAIAAVMEAYATERIAHAAASWAGL